MYYKAQPSRGTERRKCEEQTITKTSLSNYTENFIIKKMKIFR